MMYSQLAVLLFSLISFFATLPSHAQVQKCLSIEGVNLGCVPAENHGCFMLSVSNVEEGTAPDYTSKYPCSYIEGYKKHLNNPNVGPIALHCKSWKQGSNCESGEIICGSSQCNEFHQPTCSEVCKDCVDEVRAFQMPFVPKGCNIQSNGDGGCTGACRNRCSDEPFAGGIKHGSCGGPKYCGGPAGSENVACKGTVPQCPATHPEHPTFLSTKDEKLERCIGMERCPGAVNHGGYKVPPLPDGSYPECESASGQPVARVNGQCPGDSTAVTLVNISSPDCGPPKEIQPQKGGESPSCPWVKDFGYVRRDCEEVPCCCQFDPATKLARTDCPGGCPGGCPGWIQENINTTAGD